MPVQEEKRITFEQKQVSVDETIKDLNYYITMLIGHVKRQEWGIREMKGSLRSIDDRLTSLEPGVNTRFGTLDARMGAFEQNVNTRFGVLETRMETQDKKLDQSYSRSRHSRRNQIKKHSDAEAKSRPWFYFREPGFFLFKTYQSA